MWALHSSLAFLCDNTLQRIDWEPAFQFQFEFISVNDLLQLYKLLTAEKAFAGFELYFCMVIYTQNLIENCMLFCLWLAPFLNIFPICPMLVIFGSVAFYLIHRCSFLCFNGRQYRIVTIILVKWIWCGKSTTEANLKKNPLFCLKKEICTIDVVSLWNVFNNQSVS
jgi:hypothetical protein